MAPDQVARGLLVAAALTAVGTVLSLLILIDKASIGNATMFVLGCGLVAMFLSFAWRAHREHQGKKPVGPT